MYRKIVGRGEKSPLSDPGSELRPGRENEKEEWENTTEEMIARDKKNCVWLGWGWVLTLVHSSVVFASYSSGAQP